MNTLLQESSLSIINVGLKRFAEDVNEQKAKTVNVSWKPLAGGRRDIIEALDKVEALIDKITLANEEVIRKIKGSKPFLEDMDLAINAIPGMKKNLILHAGPYITWDKMCGPMKGAVIGALIFEGLASDEESALKLIESGKIEFAPCHEYNAVGPMAGVVCASMPVHIIHDREYDRYSYCSVNEGLGKVLRFGAFSDEVIDRLKYLGTEFLEVMKKAISLSGGIDIKLITAQALQMGDECHNRNKAATSLFFKEISKYILRAEDDTEKAIKALEFIGGNDHYFLNLSMPSCKIMLKAGENVPYSTIVNVMARNGVEFGIKVCGIDSSKWFTGESNYIEGLYFPGYSKEDACRDIGDSAITETMGIGGFAMGGAPAIVKFVGGTSDDAVATSKRMYEITTDVNPSYAIPTLNFKGSALGIDVIKVIENDILPVINTGIAHKEAGIGQIGAGIVSPPMECFYKALLAFAEEYC